MKYIALDIEAIGLKPYGGTIWIISISRIICTRIKTEVIHDCYGVTRIRPDIKKELEDESICKIIHNCGYDPAYIELVLGCKIRNVWDTLNLEVVIQGRRVTSKKKNIEVDTAEYQLMKDHSASLQYVLPRYGFKEPDKSIRNSFIDRSKGKSFSKAELKYAEDDTKDLLAIQKAQEFLLKRDDLLEVALLENKVAEKLTAMKVKGIGFDNNIWRSIAEQNTAEFNTRMKKLPKEVSNWNSPAQVKEYFFNKGILLRSYDEIYDVYLATRNKVLGDFIYARELHKSVTSYGLNWFEEGFIDGDSRIRCDVTQTINTGRMSMSNPNLQQLPGAGNNDPKYLRVLQLITKSDKRAAAPRHREAFVPAKGNVFVICDFSGQEIGIMAAASNEKLWIDAMLRGEDIHSLTASLINPSEWNASAVKGCTFPKKCKCPGHVELRNPAKINNFMLAYGGGPMKLAENTGMSVEVARMYVGAHKRVIPNLTKYLNDCGKTAMDTGVAYSADPYKRRRVLHGEEAWQVRNQGMNTPIQSAGANMLKLAMASTPDEFPIVLVIHDEIILEVKKDKAIKAAKALKVIMEKSADYITGIKGLIRVSPKLQTNIMKDIPTTKAIGDITTGKYCLEI
jgi:DNA polymerase I-like protein with 3'-5' exonuclease and polymerase domains